MTNPITISRTALIALILALGTTLSACGTGTSTETTETELTEAEAASNETAEATPAPVTEPSKPVQAAATPVCADCGTISNIEQKTEQGKGTGIGAAAGAVLGAVAGREIVSGKRSHRDAAAVAGAIGGGYAGHKIEQKVRSSTYYLVSVRMDDGRTETITLNSVEELSVGQKVRVDGENIILR
jgi:outer membrane lipoprotein SlyB